MTRIDLIHEGLQFFLYLLKPLVLVRPLSRSSQNPLSRPCFYGWFRRLSLGLALGCRCRRGGADCAGSSALEVAGEGVLGFDLGAFWPADE